MKRTRLLLAAFAIVLSGFIGSYALAQVGDPGEGEGTENKCYKPEGGNCYHSTESNCPCG